jgi:cytochrome c5
MNVRLRCAALATLAAVGAWAVLAAPAHADDGGARLYERNCRPCHAPGEIGYVMLTRRLGAGRADLAMRGEVLSELVRVVVRRGFNSMPPIPRGLVSDAELERIIAYLNRPRSLGADNGAGP